MIISHKHKFIFIKTQKTAGTSFEIMLSQICGQDDIICPIAPKDEIVRKRLNFRTSQHYHIPFKYYSIRDLAKFIYHRKRLVYFNHMSASLIKKSIDHHIWNSYYTFAFERNPYDKMVSWYYFCGGDHKYGNVTNFLTSDLARAIKGYDLYTECDEIIVNKVYKYEEMENAIQDFSNRIGLSGKLSLPYHRANAEYRSCKSDYTLKLSKSDREWVESQFSKELTLFNYSWD